MAWPTATELAGYLAEAGVEPVPGGLEAALAATAARFEEAAGWKPFWAEAAASVREYPASGRRRLYVDGCVALESVSVGGQAVQASSYTAVRQAVAGGALGPAYALDAQVPGLWEGGPVVVTARFGAFEPGSAAAELAVRAVLASAAALAVSASGYALGELLEVRQGPVTLKHAGTGGGRQGGRAGAWLALYDDAIAALRRVGV